MMKRLTHMVLVAGLLAGCSSPQDKAEKFFRENIALDNSANTVVDSTSITNGHIFNYYYTENNEPKIAIITFDDEAKNVVSWTNTDVEPIKSFQNTVESLVDQVISSSSYSELFGIWSKFEGLQFDNDLNRIEQMRNNGVMPQKFENSILESMNRLTYNFGSRFASLVGLEDSDLTVNNKLNKVISYFDSDWANTPNAFKDIILQWVDFLPRQGSKNYDEVIYDKLYDKLHPKVQYSHSGSSPKFTRQQAFSDAYNIGNQAGYSDGMNDAKRGYSHGHSYDTTNSYSDDWIREQYISGYMFGYDAGYSDGGGNSYPDDDDDYYDEY